MTSFIAIYRGASIGDARLIAVSTDPTIVADVSHRLLKAGRAEIEDPAIDRLERGRRSALRVINKEAGNDSAGA
jgi:hypothetical protein